MRRQIVFAIIMVIAGLAVIEGLARLAEHFLKPTIAAQGDRPGWQTTFFGAMFDWHENDPELLWRFKAGLNAPPIQTNTDHLLGPEISRTKDARSWRILLLGDSSPVGMGLESRQQAFGELARYQLDRAFGGRKTVELINAAVSGYSSAQMARFLEQRGWDFQPDVVIVYCGNNDASLSGMSSDKELLERQKFRSVRAALSHSAFYRLLRNVLQHRRSLDNDMPERLKIRVTPQEYAENIGQIVEQCRTHNCPVVLLKPPVPHLWPAGLQFKPFLQLTGRDGQVIVPEQMALLLGRDILYCLSEERFHRLYGAGDIFTRIVFSVTPADTLPPEQAERYFAAQSAAHPDDPVVLNNLGVAFWRRGTYVSADSLLRRAADLFAQQHADDLSPAVRAAASPFLYNVGINLLTMDSGPAAVQYDTASPAFAWLDSALQADYFSLRIKRPYWAVLDRFAGAPGVTVIDLPAVFRDHGGEQLFIDHCHPTAEGHRLIAWAIASRLAGEVR